MSKIQVLDQITIDKIAAGEVIERPASVVKELAENAIDAGATAVTVEIKEGGITFMRIADNGIGIDKEDVRAAFLRHSTSKIRSAEDLAHISSLGFRGEALSSIAAVSQVCLLYTSVTNAVLQGLDNMMVPVKSAAISLVIHIISLFLMMVVFKWGIYAVVLSKIVFSLSTCILNAHALREDVYKRQVLW